jgi:hypothetical protein
MSHNPAFWEFLVLVNAGLLGANGLLLLKNRQLLNLIQERLGMVRALINQAAQRLGE